MGYFAEKLLHLQKILFYLFCDTRHPPTVQITHKSILITSDTLEGLLTSLKTNNITQSQPLPSQTNDNQSIGYFHQVVNGQVKNVYFYKIYNFDCQIDAEDVSIYHRGGNFIVYSIPIDDDQHIKTALINNDSDDHVFPLHMEMQSEYYRALGLVTRCCHFPITAYHTQQPQHSALVQHPHSHTIDGEMSSGHTSPFPSSTPSQRYPKPITSVMPLPSRYWEDISEIWFCHNDKPGLIGVGKHNISVIPGRMLIDRTTVVCHVDDITPISMVGEVPSPTSLMPPQSIGDATPPSQQDHFLFQHGLHSSCVPAQIHISGAIIQLVAGWTSTHLPTLPPFSTSPLLLSSLPTTDHPIESIPSPTPEKFDVFPSSFLDTDKTGRDHMDISGDLSSIANFFKRVTLTPSAWTAPTTSPPIETTKLLSLDTICTNITVFLSLTPLQRLVVQIYLTYVTARRINMASQHPFLIPQWIHFWYTHASQLLAMLDNASASENKLTLYIPLFCGCCSPVKSTAYSDEPLTIGEVLVSFCTKYTTDSHVDSGLLPFSAISHCYDSLLLNDDATDGWIGLILPVYHRLSVFTQYAFHHILQCSTHSAVRLFKFGLSSYTPMFASQPLKQAIVSHPDDPIVMMYNQALLPQVHPTQTDSIDQTRHPSSQPETPVTMMMVEEGMNTPPDLDPIHPCLNIFYPYTFEATIASLLLSLCHSRLVYRVSITDANHTVGMQMILMNFKMAVKFTDDFTSIGGLPAHREFCNDSNDYEYPKYAQPKQTRSCIKVLYRFIEPTDGTADLKRSLQLWTLLGNGFQLQWSPGTIRSLHTILLSRAKLLPTELRSNPAFNTSPLFKHLSYSYLLRLSEYLSPHSL